MLCHSNFRAAMELLRYWRGKGRGRVSLGSPHVSKPFHTRQSPDGIGASRQAHAAPLRAHEADSVRQAGQPLRRYERHSVEIDTDRGWAKRYYPSERAAYDSTFLVPDVALE